MAVASKEKYINVQPESNEKKRKKAISEFASFWFCIAQCVTV